MRRATCILWDIDGTLTEFVHPTGDRFTSYFETRGLTMANPAPELVGTTEAGIVASYLNSDSHEDIGYHLRAMDAKWLLEDTSRAVPIASAKDLMLEMRDFTLQTIVTGNTYLRATKKLHDAGFLDCGIDIGRGAFGDESTSRADLVRLAIARCRRAKPGVPPENWNFVCIGDTPIDGRPRDLLAQQPSWWPPGSIHKECWPRALVPSYCPI